MYVYICVCIFIIINKNLLIQAKLLARRERRLAEEQRIAEEMAAQKLLEEQARQMRHGAVVLPEGDLFKAPEVMYTESLEEAALKKEQVCKMCLCLC